MDIYWSVCVLLVGLCFGSFLNVCIYRIPKNISLSNPPSTCPKCKTLIKWYDNIPALGWLALWGKCRACKASISVRYPIIELVFGLICLGLWIGHGVFMDQPFIAITYCLAAFGLLLGTFVDIEEMWLPDRVTIGGMIIFPIASVLIPELHDSVSWLSSLKSSLLGLAVGFGGFWTIGFLGTLVFRKDAMGFGDVKLMGGLGALFGWQAVLFILFISSLFGSIIGVGLICMNKKEMSSQIPYGPYLALAAFAWMFGGSSLWSADIQWMGL
ncbi:MAG: prepilin peptidase [Candidatus Margulisbacteria bacterium]|nr:prepilin peptidase [Candidatus Margulisiibacteriota bacterium]